MTHAFLATCPAGVGVYLAQELEGLGAEQIVERPVGVSFEGGLGLAYRACLWSRMANRIILQLGAAQADSANDLYEATRQRMGVILVGPSGCGKSTLIRILAGLESASTGEVLLAGHPVDTPGPDRGMVFQGYTLFPWLTVKKNVTFGLRNQGLDDAEASREALEWIQLVGLEKFADVYPDELSGGMKQRVAIARALMHKPSLVLADEPTGSLDEETSEKVIDLLVGITSQLGATLVVVTHSTVISAHLTKRWQLFAGQISEVK